MCHFKLVKMNYLTSGTNTCPAPEKRNIRLDPQFPYLTPEKLKVELLFKNVCTVKLNRKRIQRDYAQFKILQGRKFFFFKCDANL